MTSELYPNELIEAHIEGVEVFDFLILIDALLQQDRGIDTDRNFITENVDLVANLFKAINLLAEGNDPAIFEYEDGEDDNFEDECTRCDEFPNNIDFWINDTTISLRAEKNKVENNLIVFIEFNKGEKSLLELFINCF